MKNNSYIPEYSCPKCDSSELEEQEWELEVENYSLEVEEVCIDCGHKFKMVYSLKYEGVK